ncbi:unnamed protein product [Caenorhabditis sp. 36 PRJEB53466]|nr:unnamed protein product [Caenorhabditis sp. 36 PRJEB53466]
MSSTADYIVSGVLADGTPIVFGALVSHGTSTSAIHHVSSTSQFAVESWDGEHAEREHHDHDEAVRRFSLYLEPDKPNEEHDEEEEPIASSAQFERTRSASLAAALLELDPRGVPLVQFFKLATSEPLLELDEGDDEVEPTEAELVLSHLLFTLRAVKMSSDGDAKHSDAVQRLRELEEELRAAGAVTPADPAVSEAVARALAVAGAGRDVQIRVNQSKHTTTTKTVYETETPAMAHMDSEQIRNLQHQILADISSGAEHHAGHDSGTTQKKETAEEGFTNEDGSVIVSKKMTRVVTTTRTTLPGEGEEPSAPASPVEATSLGSVKDRIAKFEQLKDFGAPEHELLEPSVGIVITPHTPVPPEHSEEHPEDEDEPREALELAEPEHVAHAQLKDTREYSDEELSQELQPSEEHVATAEIKDIKSYSPTSSEEGKVSPSPRVAPVPQARQSISPSVASSAHHDDELAAHFVAESFEKHDEGRVEHMEHTPVYRGHRSPGQTSPIVSEHPIAQEYAESVTSHDEEPDNLSLKSGHEAEIARHSEEEEERDSLQKDNDEEPEELTTQTTITESPIRHEDVLAEFHEHSPVPSERQVTREFYEEPEHPEELKSHSPASQVGHDEPDFGHIVRETTTTVTRDFHEDREKTPSPAVSEDYVSPVPSNKDTYSPAPVEMEDQLIKETTTTTTVTREFYDQPEQPVESYSPAPSSHVESERPEEHPHIIETTTTTTVTRDYHDAPEEPTGRAPESGEESDGEGFGSKVLGFAKKAGMVAGAVVAAPVALAAVGAKTAYDALKKDSDEEEPEEHEGLLREEERQRRASPSGSSSPVPSEGSVTRVVETTTTTVTRGLYEEEPHHDAQYFHEQSESPVPAERTPLLEKPRHDAPADSGYFHEQAEHEIPTEHAPLLTEKQPESGEESDGEGFGSKVLGFAKKAGMVAGAVVAAPVALAAVGAKTAYDALKKDSDEEPEEPERRALESPTSSEQYQEPIHESSEPEKHHITETTTTTTVTREFYDEPVSPVPSDAAGSPVESEKSIPHVVETTTTTTVTRDFDQDASGRGSPVPSEPETTTVTREVYQAPHGDEPEHHFTETTTTTVTQKVHDEPSEEDAGQGEPEEELPHVVETITTTTSGPGSSVPQSPVLSEKYQEHDEPKPEVPSEKHLSASSSPSSQPDQQNLLESPAVSEKELPHVVEKEGRASEVSSPSPVSPTPSEKEPEAHLISETTTITTVHREFYDEPKHLYEHPQESSHVESERYEGSPVVSEKELPHEPEQESYSPAPSSQAESERPHVVETTTTTTTTREFFDEPEEPTGSPSPLTETTTTTTVTREFYDEPEEQRPDEELFEVQPVADTTTTVSREIYYAPENDDQPESEHHVIEKTTTTTISRELHEEPGSPTGEIEPHYVETSTTTTVTREYEQPEEEGEKYVPEEPTHHRTSSEVAKESSVAEHLEPEHQQPEYDSERLSEPASSPIPESPVGKANLPLVSETIMTGEHYEEEPEEPIHREASPIRSEYAPASPSGSSSPVPSERSVTRVVETTTTTVTRGFHEEEPHHDAQYFHEQSESPEPAERTSLLEEPRHDAPADSGYFHEQAEHEIPTEHAPLLTEQQPESGEESDGEGFGSKVLGFAKKAGMVAGAVVAAPVALAAVGAKTAYDALKKDSDEEPEEPERRALESPISSEQYQEPIHESSEPEKHHITETTTTTTVTREFYDEPVSPVPSDTAGSPMESEKSIPHVVETTTTTTVTRDFDQDASGRGSPVPSEPETTTVTREVYQAPHGDEPEHHFTETTTTTVTQKVHDEPSEEDAGQGEPEEELPHVVESTTTTTVTRDYEDEDEEAPHVTETTTTTTVIREFYGEEPEELECQSPVPSEKDKDSSSPTSETSTSVSREVHPDEPHVVETTTTTTVTREYHDQSERQDPEPEHDSERLSEPASSPIPESPLLSETREYYEEEPDEPIHREASPVQSEQDVSSSPVPSESSVARIVDTTLTTVTREFDQEEPHRDAPVDRQFHEQEPEEHEALLGERRGLESPVSSDNYQERHEPEASQKSPVPSEKHDHHVAESTKFSDEPESPIPSDHEAIHRSERLSEPTSSAESEQDLSRVIDVNRHFDQEDPDEPVHSEELLQFQGEQSLEELEKEEAEERAAHEPVAEPRLEREGSYSPGYSPKSPDGSLAESDEESRKIVETVTTTTTTRTHEVPDEPEKKSEDAAPEEPEDLESPVKSPYEQPTEYGRVDSHDAPASPAPSVESAHESIVIETTTITTVHEPEDAPRDVVESQEYTGSPVPSEHAPLLTEKQTESGEESDGEGFGSKVLGFAKKAGMVAGAVVAAPVALAAVGAKTAYDALKKDSDEVEPEEHEALLREEERQRRVSESPVSSEKPLIGVGDDQPVHHYTETTTTTTVTREHFDETESYSPAPSSRSEKQLESPAASEKDIPYQAESNLPAPPSVGSPEKEHSEVVESTTVVTREYYHDEPEDEPVHRDAGREETTEIREVYDAPGGEHFIETTTTTTVTKEVYEPVHDDAQVDREEPEGYRPASGSEADDESHAPRYLETTTTTTVIREYEVSEDEEDHAVPQESPTPSEETVSRIVESTTTTIVTHYEPEDEHEKPRVVESQEYASGSLGSPVPSEEGSLKLVETTTVTQEHYEPEDERVGSPKSAGHVVESQEYEHGSLVPSEEPEESIHRDAPASPSGSSSPVPSERSVTRVVETTTTTVTRGFHEEEPHHESPAAQYFHEQSESPEPAERTPLLEEPQHDAPADSGYFHEQGEHEIPTEHAPLLTEKQTESGEESDGEGFGSKVLGFAKKAGMVAGAVVAAPVALAAVGAKTAYDALKKDSDEEEPEEHEGLLREEERQRRAVESPEHHEPAAKFYEPFEEDRSVQSASPVKEEPKIISPAQSIEEIKEKLQEAEKRFEEEVDKEPFVIESEEYEPAVHEEQRISSPVHSDSGDVEHQLQKDVEKEEEEEEEEEEEDEADAPYIIDSEEYEFVGGQEERISSPAHEDEEDEDVIESEVYQRHHEEHDPSIIESEEYENGSGSGSGSGSPRPFEESTTTTVISVHHEPPAIPEPEVDEEEFEEDRSIIESQEYSSGSPLPPTTVTSVEHVEPEKREEYTPEYPTTVAAVSSEHLDGGHIIESQEYTGSPVPSEESAHGFIKTTTTTTTVTREHFEPEDELEPSASPAPSEEAVSRVVETTTTTTVTREHFEPEENVVVSPVPSEEGSPKVIETTTTTTVTREHYEPEDEEEHIVESQEYLGSPVRSEKSLESEQSVTKVVETTTTTTVTREYVDAEDAPAPPALLEEPVDRVQETTTTTVTRENYEPELEENKSPVPSEEEEVHGFIKTTTTTTTVTSEHFEPEEEEPHHDAPHFHEQSESPVPAERTPLLEEPQHDAPADSGYFHEQAEHEIPTEHAPLLTEEQTESGEESDGEGFGSKVLGFAKKAGMVAGAVVAAPVALAAVGAKTAYDALKKDSDEEPEEPERRALESPISSEQYQEPIHESSEPEKHHITETTTTTTVTREFYDEPVSPVPSDTAGSLVESEKSIPHVVETTTTTTVTRDFDQDASGRGSPVPSEPETTTVTREVYQAPRGDEYELSRKDSDEEAEEPERRALESPVSSEKHEEPEERKVLLDEPLHYQSSELQRPAPTIESQPDDSSESEGSFVDHGEPEGLPAHSTEAAFKLSTEDVAEQTAQKLVSEVFTPLNRTLIESEQYRASIESLNREPEHKKSVEDDLASEALQNVTKISYGDAEAVGDKADDEDEEWKVYDRHGEVLEEFSTQLTDNVIQEAEGDATSQIMMSQAEYSPSRSKFLKQESCQEISNEPEVDYYSDLQEKLMILAGEKDRLGALPEEEPSSGGASDQLDVIHESDQEHQESEELEEAAEHTAIQLVDQVLEQISHELGEQEEDQKTMTSDAYLTATESKDDQYDTCVTSQDDTYESAQGWTSQDSEYTSATSQAPSRLSDEESGEQTARETSTPQAALSPVDSDRHFTVQADFEMPVIKAFGPDDYLQSTARSTPDVALQVTIEEEDESDDKLPISPSGVLLPPATDPGRPVSPVPPRREPDGGVFVFGHEEDVIAEPTPPPQPFEEEVARRQETERIHGLAMEASSDPANSESSRYSRQLSDLSSSAESHADTVIRVDPETERSGSTDSLEVVSVIDVPEKPEDEPSAEQLGFEVYEGEVEQQQQQQQPEELETVEEEPEDSDSLNESGNHSSGHSSVGVPADTLAMIGKYRHQSSDNLSLTSLQEFERLEKEVGARGDGSLTRSEIELLMAGRLNKSGEGSASSLAEFERLEKEMTENQSPPEDVMMLSDIREESEAEDMSICNDDDEEQAGSGSDTELKSRPVQEEDLRVITPIAPSPTDSLEHSIDPIQLQYLETSTDSLEPTFQEIEVEQRPDSVEDTSLTEYEVVPKIMEASTTDSLDGAATIERDSLLEGASQGIESTQSTHGLLSGDTMRTLVTDDDDDDKDSLDGEVSSMLQSYPTTLTTFQTTAIGTDGTVQTISRRVETKVTDPLVSHVTFTGTESQERLDQLPDDQQFETVDTEGNVTRTTYRRDHDQHSHY